MKILIVNNMAPFLWGGAEELAENLRTNLILAGHESEILRIPFQWEPYNRIPSQMLLAKTCQLFNVDRVIALKFPAYLIEHPQKTLWLLHQYRQAYDLYDAGHSNIPNAPMGDAIKSLIKNADDICFSNCRAIYTNSKITQDRLKKYNNFSSEVLLPPVNDPFLFKGGDTKNYIFAGGRINSMKRQHLLIEALLFTSSNVKLIIAGPPDSPEDAMKLSKLVALHKLEDRVTLDLRFLPRETYADYVNHCNAIAYLPYDEDSLGYVAMEGAEAGKPLLTLSDSGGILGLALNQNTGWVAEPNPESIAKAMDEIFQNPNKSLKFGKEIKNYWGKMGINWPNTIEKLLQ